MGQKINANLYRLKITKGFNSNWFATKKGFAGKIKADHKIRAFLKKELRDADLDRIEIERIADKTIVNIHTGKPGIVIGRSGENIEKLKQKVQNLVGDQVEVNVKEVAVPELSAAIQARAACDMLERRMPFRRVGKGLIEKVMQKNARGVKVRISGRLGGADIARAEHFSAGDTPMQTLRCDIDYAHAEARTTYGVIGVKVWINRGEKKS